MTSTEGAQLDLHGALYHPTWTRLAAHIPGAEQKGSEAADKKTSSDANPFKYSEAVANQIVGTTDSFSSSDFDQLFWESGISRSEFEKALGQLISGSGTSRSEFEKEFGKLLYESGISSSDFEKEFDQLISESGISSSDFEKEFGKLFSESGISNSEFDQPFGTLTAAPDIPGSEISAKLSSAYPVSDRNSAIFLMDCVNWPVRH